MLNLRLEQGGKRYNRDWIFRNLNVDLHSGDSLAILGGNGSGKSTALRSLAGYATLTEGNLKYHYQEKTLKQGELYRTLSYCSPYLELYEELSLDEITRFHFSLKPPLPELRGDFAAIIGLEASRGKGVKYFSSGMKQRLRIGLAVLSDTAVVFLDEPLSNLDQKARDWYRDLVDPWRGDRILIVASNHQKEEYYFCQNKINIEDYKSGLT
jgi:ABC-type multidrug transport system ATPase subunit